MHHDGSREDHHDARLFWRSSCDPSVVVVDAEPVPHSHREAFDLAWFSDFASVLVDAAGQETFILADGGRQIQFEVGSGTVLSGAVRLHYRLAGFDAIDQKLRTVQRLNVLRRSGRFPIRLFPPETKAGKWANALQAYDGLSAGASHRMIAIALYSERVVREDWGGHSDFLRLRVQRLLGYGRKMVAGGWRTLLVDRLRTTRAMPSQLGASPRIHSEKSRIFRQI